MEKASRPSSSGSSRNTGYTTILQETVAPTTQPTQKSPTPCVDLIAGLGVASVLLRLRK